MGWSYMITCITDFIIFPILWSILQTLSDGQVTSQWDPITLRGAGLYHISMGAILGITAYGRSREKIYEFNNPYYSRPPSIQEPYPDPNWSRQAPTYNTPTRRGPIEPEQPEI